MRKKGLYSLILLFLFLPNIVFGFEKESTGMTADFLKAPNPAFRNSLNNTLSKKISVNFDNVHIREVVQYLSFIGGLSIVLDETPFAHDKSIQDSDLPADDADEESVASFSNEIKESKYIITIHLNDIPIKNVLWSLCAKSDLMAFFDDDIDGNVPGPIVITSKEQAEKIMSAKVVERRRKKNLQRALNSFDQKYK